MPIRKVPRVRQAHENPVKFSLEEVRLRRRRGALFILFMSIGALAILANYYVDMRYVGYFAFMPRLVIQVLVMLSSIVYLIASRKKKPKEKEFCGIALNADGTVGRMS